MAKKKPTNNKAREPQRGRTPETRIPPPPGHREDVLPLVAVGSKKFEELCRAILKPQFKDVLRVALKRTSGVEQYGVDVEGFDQQHDPVVVLSAKCYQKVDAWEFRPWIQDFFDHLDGHWKGKNVRHFILAVTVAANDDDMNEAARTLAKSLAQKGIQFHLWDSVHITDLLRNDPRLIDRYFHRYWVDAMSAEIESDSPSVNPASTVSPNKLGGSIAALAAQLQDAISGPFNSAVSRELEAAVAELRRGKRSAVRKWIASNRAEEATWQTIDPAVRAKGLRILAMIELAEGDLDKADALVSEANDLSEELDPSARVMIARVTAGVGAALEELGKPTTRRERELAAGLSIDADDPRAALNMLAPLVGDDVSSEVLRLRGIATLMSGRGAAAALNLVNSALSKEPEGAIARLTRGIVRIASALVEGVLPGFGGPPNPINRALVRSEQVAYDQLDAARQEFEGLLSVVDGDLRREVEIWKLAVLILHPERRQEARRYGRYLLSRPVPDPSAIAWCLQNNLPMRRGKIKKAIGDLLRKGEGTPGHVVALALLAAKVDKPSRAIAVFEKFKRHFPEAEEFFNEWRKQFGENAGSPEASYSAAVRYGIEAKNYAPLIAFLSSGLSNAEALIAGSEFLMSRKAYVEVFKLRNQLTAIGTLRAFEIASVAAFRSDNAQSSVEVLTEASRAGLALPPRLVQLRLRAQEATGDHLNLIKDLKSLLSQSDDPDLRRQLFNAYVRIGALEDAARVTNDAIAARSLDYVNALRVANALRNFAPDTARRVIADIQRDQLPKELLPQLLALSSELGLRDVQDEMIRRLVSEPGSEGMMTRFDSVEAVIKFMNERADQYRVLIDQWLAGSIPSALAFSGDAKDYALLFLGDRNSRRANFGLKFPMFLTAGTKRSADTIDTTRRPGLRLDLSALLLADRAGILDKIEQVFDIHIPASLPEALIEMRGKFGTVSAEIARQVRAVARRDSAVKIVASPKEGVFVLEALRHAPEDDAGRGIFTTLLENAFQSGHVTRAEMQKARESLGIPDDMVELSFDTVMVGQSACLDLMLLGLLEPIARSFPTNILQADLDQMLAQIALFEFEEGIGNRLETLRKTVAARLASSAWHSLPSRDEEFRAMRREAPAHVRCLLETLPREEGVDPLLYWIEDRTISRNPPSNAVNLGQILATLRQAGRLGNAEYYIVIKLLRDAGYSFLPIDADELYAQISAAPIVSGRVVENDDLMAIQSWFAQDAINLKHIDLTVEIDPSGHVIGESRRTLQLTHIAQDLFARIWADPTATDEQKVARSSWVWSNLRLDCTPARTGSEQPHVLRQFGALNVSQALALPLHAELGEPELAKSDRASYVNWLMATVVEPLVEADPEAGDIIAETIAGMLARLLETPDDTDKRLKKAFESQMRRVVAEYLRLLPLDWADRVASRRGIDDILDRQTVMLLEIGDERVAVRSIAAAFTEAFSSPRRSARFQFHESKKFAQISLDDSEQGKPKAIVKRGRKSYPLDPVTMAILHPDPRTRERTLKTSMPMGSVGKPISEDELVAVANEPSPERRIEVIHDLYSADFSRQLTLLDARLKNTEQLRIADFELPEPGVLLNYLGIAADFSGNGAELIESSFRILSDKISPEEAVWRTSSIPRRVPEELLESYTPAIRKAPGDAQRFLSLSLTRAFTLARTGELRDEDLNFLGMLDDERLRFFRTILRHSGRQALSSEDWRKLNPEIAFYLLWLHADQLMRVLSPSNSALRALGDWLYAQTPRRLTDDQEVWGRWVRNSVFSLSAIRIRAAIAAELLDLGATVPADQITMLGRDTGGDWMPNPQLLATLPSGSPDLCWISRDPIPVFLKAGWMVPDSAFVVRDPSGLLTRIIQEMRDENWRVLVSLVSLVVDITSVDEASLSELNRRIDSYLKLDDALDVDPSRSALMDVAAKVFGRQAADEAFQNLITVVGKTARSRWPRENADLHGEADVDGLALDLANAIHLFSWARHSETSARMMSFCRLLLDVATVWRGFRSVALELLESVLAQADIPTAAVSVWPALFELKACR
ncbi:hypothetical protein [Martelella sp. AD-3]|uniref:hypothetical protein n=1 Tax=Martelella sp. AD-3 TaxID=686597 RepID=UPI000464A5CA|nr:hypothetical protein [Martelella sp. AD-3]